MQRILSFLTAVIFVIPFVSNASKQPQGIESFSNITLRAELRVSPASSENSWANFINFAVGNSPAVIQGVRVHESQLLSSNNNFTQFLMRNNHIRTETAGGVEFVVFDVRVNNRYAVNNNLTTNSFLRYSGLVQIRLYFNTHLGVQSGIENLGGMITEIRLLENPVILPDPPTVTITTAAPAQLRAGDTFQLNAVTAPTQELVMWLSNAMTVATVSQTGLVTAVGAGSVRITARLFADAGVYDYLDLNIQPVLQVPPDNGNNQNGNNNNNSAAEHPGGDSVSVLSLLFAVFGFLIVIFLALLLVNKIVRVKKNNKNNIRSDNYYNEINYNEEEYFS